MTAYERGQVQALLDASHWEITGHTSLEASCAHGVSNIQKELENEKAIEDQKEYFLGYLSICEALREIK